MVWGLWPHRIQGCGTNIRAPYPGSPRPRHPDRGQCAGKAWRISYLLAMRRPVYRRRDSHSGSLTELGNLAGDAKGKGTSGENCEAESTDAPARGGLLRISEEAG